MNQMSLVEGRHAKPFWKFHTKHPQVYCRLIEMLEQMRQRGRQRVGMGMLFEVLRWEHYLYNYNNEPFKLNNNYRAYYTRLIRRERPDLGALLTSRESAADEDVA